MMSSTIPSAKDSCSGSGLSFWNSGTAVDGLSETACAGRLAAGATDQHAINSRQASIIFDRLVAQILEAEIELVANLVAHDPADADAARIGQGFEACGEVDAVAVNVALVDDNIAEIDADAEFNRRLSGNVGAALCHVALHLDRTANRIDDTGEFNQCAIAGGFDEAAAVLSNFWVDQFA
jgi:hypothetical protein